MMDEPALDPGTQQPAPPVAATFTREELDAAEPERHPSVRRRWLIGLGLGVFAALYTGVPLGIAALPFALTGAGAGTLLGTGLVFGVSFAFDVVVWLDGDRVAVDTWSIGVASLAGFLALIVGVVATIVVTWRSRRRPGA